MPGESSVPLVEFMYLVFTRMPVERSVPLVEFMYLVFTRMPGESYGRRLRSLLYLCYIFRALVNSLDSARALVLFQICVVISMPMTSYVSLYSK